MIAKKTWMAGLLAGVGLIGSSFAANIAWDTPSGNWTVATNWIGGVVPGSSDAAFINRYDATIDSDVGSIAALFAGFTDMTGTLHIVDGGSLVVTTDSGRIGRAGYSNAVGVINMTGGTLQYGASQDKRLILGLDSSVANGEQGMMTISGGTFAGQLLIGQNLVGGSIDTFRVEGDAATIGSSAVTSTHGLEVRYTGVLEFALNETGISTMTFADTASFHSSSKIIVDGAAYTGAGETFTLIDAASFSGTPQIILANFYGGASYNWDAATGEFTVTANAPGAVAANRVWNSSDGLWSDPLNWSGYLQPRSIDNTFMNAGAATINADVGSIATLYMGYTSLTGTLNMVDGGSLLVTSESGRIGRAGYSGSGGVINMTGGTLQYGDDQDKRLMLGLDSSAEIGEYGEMTISGGTFAGKLLIGANVVGGSEDLFRVEGNAATIGSTNVNGVYGLELRYTGAMEFAFDEDGISPMNFADNAWFHPSAKILVDGSSFVEPGSNTYTLISAASFTGTPSITVTNFTDPVSYEWDPSGSFTVTVDAPELLPELVSSHLTVSYSSNSLVIASEDLNALAQNTLQMKTDLSASTWSNVTTFTGSSTNAWMLTPPDSSSAFYRIVSEYPVD